MNIFYYIKSKIYHMVENYNRLYNLNDYSNYQRSHPIYTSKNVYLIDNNYNY